MNMPNLKTPVKLPARKIEAAKEKVRELIWKYHGIRTLICLELECTHPQLDRLLDKLDLNEEMESARKCLLDKAQAVLFNAMDSESESTQLRAAEDIVRFMGSPSTLTIQATGDAAIDLASIFGV